MTLGPPSSPNKACFRAQIYHCPTDIYEKTPFKSAKEYLCGHMVITVVSDILCVWGQLIIWVCVEVYMGVCTAVSDILEGCVLVGPRNARFFTFSDRLLTISHAMYLVSNKATSNRTKITVFLHISYIYLRTCHPSSPKFELLKIVLPGRCKKCQRPGKPFWGSPILPGMSGFLHFFQYSCSTLFFLNIPM